MPLLSPWRLIPPIATSGAIQMAIDHWLLSQHQQGLQPSVLRFYTWSPVGISLGYHQKRYPDHWSGLRWRGKAVDLVHRPTGGRAVLHQGDLTYATITSAIEHTSSLEGHNQRTATYRKLCEFLIQGWRSLGITLTFGKAERSYKHTANCFGTSTVADLLTPEGYKLIGSAQLYRDSCVLQHGSIRLNPDASLFEQVFGEPLQPIRLWVTEADVIKALTNAAAHCFEVDFAVQPLSAEEIQAACQKSES